MVEGVLAADVRCLSRVITLIENREPRARQIQSAIFRHTGKAQVYGVTGSPGAGKSTLVDQLAAGWLAAKKKVAILAIDPSSPFSGGAVLGDRVRMVKAAENRGAFIRSMATRGSLGGLSHATLEAVQVLDAAGIDIILVETVGVGQAEVDIVRTADTCVVVLVPGMGDSVQAMKAGILEIADVFVINKSDREGADLLHRDLRTLLSLTETGPEEWSPPIVKTVATDGQGTVELIQRLEEHRSWLDKAVSFRQKRLSIIEDTIIKLTSERIVNKLLSSHGDSIKKAAAACLERKNDPYTTVEELVKLMQG